MNRRVATRATVVTLSRLIRFQAIRAGERPATTGPPGLESCVGGSVGGAVPPPVSTGWCCVVIVLTSRICPWGKEIDRRS
ncbi:hypothetical protein GCM10010384_51570 [Streptomyces djakartensis]|uniref:Secreted protein n=1 Tax=Streptomyces djakartensis TaxID=68193 RepID=A0ABQ3A7P8_9ACTN|nr:hypothetical protein GCM10010384_51570 [Streptomyces djakartensis]